ncbi:hypothetical protein C9I56_16275 [Paraburkholderia caribensis]|uniref:Uncharacterized protein n=1 Tax=Paraburkholderia caribensis TaxID=75105 RepID=A0A9Q6S1S4_9BURK|nr:hypothetical protein C9I56_16275 [Paraburkholderia caribensis]QLB62948.1 hypothetical protein A9O66_11480 [Paraburkholderia caribensis]
MVEWNRETPWRQGFLLGNDAIDALGLRHPVSPDKTIVVVATHDCDLAQDPQFEPVVEVVVGCLAAKDGNCTHAKNARKLHIEFAGDAPFWAEFEATAKVDVDKLKLNEYAPRSDVRLRVEDYAVLQMWLASRYRRSAFADEFERRLTKETKLAEKIAKAVKPHGELISGVFFDVDEGKEVTRVGPDDTYMLDITILHTAEPDFEAAENAAQSAADAIQKAFKEKLFDPSNKWQHIELRFCDPISESVLTYQVFRQLKRWRLEHMSLAADPQQALLPE